MGDLAIPADRGAFNEHFKLFWIQENIFSHKKINPSSPHSVSNSSWRRLPYIPVRKDDVVSLQTWQQLVAMDLLAQRTRLLRLEKTKHSPRMRAGRGLYIKVQCRKPTELFNNAAFKSCVSQVLQVSDSWIHIILAIFLVFWPCFC